MKIRWILVILVISLFALMTVGCSKSHNVKAPEQKTVQEQPTKEGAKPEVDKSNWPQKLVIASGPVGGSYSAMAVPWATNISAALGLTISNESTAGGPTNTQMISEDSADFGCCDSMIAYEAWVGSDWTKGKKIEDIRTLIVFDPFVIQFYTDKKTDIKSLNEIRGKRINPSRANTVPDVVFRRLDSLFEVKPSKVFNLNPADANTQLADGLLDVAMVQGPVPHPSLSEYAALHDTVVFGFDKDQAAEYIKHYPGLTTYEIPAGTFKNQEGPITTISSYFTYITNKNMPDSLVYEIVKSTFANKDKLAGAYKSYSLLEAKNILYSTIPIHPGSVKYYEEAGIKIPENLRAQ
jgi:TRAP transporter TAXI family solute receptor